MNQNIIHNSKSNQRKNWSDWKQKEKDAIKRMEEIRMQEQTVDENGITWDDAIETSKFVEFEEGVAKILKVTNHSLQKVPEDSAIAAGKIEFVADVLEEDKSPVKVKIFTTASNRLKEKLRPIFENRLTTDEVNISITKVGEGYNTQWVVQEL